MADKITLRKYQEQAVDKILTYNKACMEACCGAGKSIMIAEIARRLMNERILMIVPSKELCEQNFEKLNLLGVPTTIYSASMRSKELSQITLGTPLSLVKAPELAFDTLLIDECLEGDCEVLTQNGWMNFKDAYNQHFTQDIQVAQYDSQTKNISFVTPTRWIKKQSSEQKICLTVRGNYVSENSAQIIMTKNHRQLLKTRRGDKVYDAKSIPKVDGNKLYTSSVAKSENVPPILKLYIATAADAYCRARQDGLYYYRFAFRRERKCQQLKTLLEECSVNYKKTTNKRGDVIFTFVANFPKTLRNIKLDQITNGQARTLCLEFAKWDGHQCDQKRFEYYTNKKEEQDFAQALAALGGFTTTVKNYPAGSRVVFRSTNAKALYYRYFNIELCEYYEPTFCVSVPTTFFVVRKNNFVFITGNCHFCPIEAPQPVKKRVNGRWRTVQARPTYWQIIDKVKPKRIYGFTGTPYRICTRSEKGSGGKFYSYSTIKHIGQLWKNMVSATSMKDLQKMGYLAKTKYVVWDVDYSRFRFTATGEIKPDDVEQFENETTEELLRTAREVAAKDGARAKIVIFVNSIQYVDFLTAKLNSMGYRAAAIHSNIKRKDSEDAVDGFKNGNLQFLINDTVIQVGFDSPNVSSIIWAKLTSSPNVYVQSVGRGLRKMEGKEYVTIYDMAGTYNKFGAVEDIVSFQVGDNWHVQADGNIISGIEMKRLINRIPKKKKPEQNI